MALTEHQSIVHFLISSPNADRSLIDWIRYSPVVCKSLTPCSATDSQEAQLNRPDKSRIYHTDYH